MMIMIALFFLFVYFYTYVCMYVCCFHDEDSSNVKYFHSLFIPFSLQKEQLIEGALRVLGNIAELIDTTDNVCTFKYMGQVCNREGIEAWALQMIQDIDPSVEKVLMLTNRKRDKRD